MTRPWRMRGLHKEGDGQKIGIRGFVFKLIWDESEQEARAGIWNDEPNILASMQMN